MTQRLLNPAIEGLSRSALSDLQLHRLKKQLARCATQVPFYRDRWNFKIDSIESLDDFRSLVPYTAKSDFVSERPESNGRIIKDATVFQYHMTSGTTGLGQETHPLSLADHEALGAGWQYQACWAGLERGDRICFTWPTGLQTGGLSTSITAERIGLVAIQLGPYSSADKIRYMHKFQPHAVVASPSYISHLQYLIESEGTTPAQAFPLLKVLFIAGENYPLSWAEKVTKDWDCTVSEWYGLMQGGMNQAFSCESGVTVNGKRGALHNLDHRILTEVLDTETGNPVIPGESGEIVMTTLTRDAFPVIRFKTGDQVRVLPEPCPCGRPFLSLEAGTVTRLDDMLKVRGQNLWPAAVDNILIPDPSVAEYAGVVRTDEHAREEILVSVEFLPGAQGEEHKEKILADLKNRVKSATNLSMEFNVAEPGSLPRFEFKTRRWKDLRREDRHVVQYVTQGE